MSDNTFQLVVYCIIIGFASILGGLVPIIFKLTHRQIQFALSFVAGILLGVALLHLLPHAMMIVPRWEMKIFYFLLAGLVTMFLLERFFSFHHHDIASEETSIKKEKGTTCHVSHDLNLTWTGVAIGLSLHSFFCGMALAASFHLQYFTNQSQMIAGLGVFLAILAHKPFDALTLSTLMTKDGYSSRAKLIANLLFALVVPLGVICVYIGLQIYSGGNDYVAYMLSFSAGMFLFISLSDLLPELHFHSHDKVKLTLLFLLGIVVIWISSEIEHATHSNHHSMISTH